MPMSNTLHLPVVLHFIETVKPKKILDIGVGMGSYGFILRQYLDISQERLNKLEWQIQIDGVEVFEGYRNPVWDYAYNNVLIGDIRNIIRNLEQYDVILCNDILEHFHRKEARLLVKELLEYSPVIIATTPNIEFSQGVWAGNEAEEHHCLLDSSDFPQLILQKVTGITTCYVCCSDKSLIQVLQTAGSSCPTYHLSHWTYLKSRIKKKIYKIFALTHSKSK